MLQLVIWMMCAYFVLKAGEWWLTASASPEETRAANRTLAGILGGAAVVLAGLFFFLALDAGMDIANTVAEMPEIDIPDLD